MLIVLNLNALRSEESWLKMAPSNHTGKPVDQTSDYSAAFYEKHAIIDGKVEHTLNIMRRILRFEQLFYVEHLWKSFIHHVINMFPILFHKCST
jgi:hypothetical protein